MGNIGYKPRYEALKIFNYIGPGLLVTVGFIDPGNWASNIAAGAGFGYSLLWMVTLSTIMLILLQHNVAHLGIATGLCLSEAATLHTPKWISRSVLSSAMIASISTSLAEILGGAIALDMLFGIPVPVGAFMVVIFVAVMLLTNSYRVIEKAIMGFVSIIGLSFLYELKLVDLDWHRALHGWVTPSIPDGSIAVIMSVLGAVVMPHNLFLHSEIIQSRQWNLEGEETIKNRLDYEFFDTLFAMIVGWAINSAMMLLAAAAFFYSGSVVGELQQAQSLLAPLLGRNSAVIFAAALLLAGISSSITSAYAGGSIYAGSFGRPYDIKDNYSRVGVGISLAAAFIVILFIANPFKALIISQMVLSIQLPLTIFLQIYLTSSPKVMGKHANGRFTATTLLAIGILVTLLNFLLFLDIYRRNVIL